MDHPAIIMAALNRTERISRRIVESRCCCIELNYWMDGVVTGELSLLYDGRLGDRLMVPRQMAAWKSAATGLTTPWHGEWKLGDDGTYTVHFHCLGKHKFLHKSVLKPGGVGIDYLDRLIVCEVKAFYVFDEPSMTFIFDRNYLVD